jgi:hypothetical protein
MCLLRPEQIVRYYWYSVSVPVLKVAVTWGMLSRAEGAQSLFIFWVLRCSRGSTSSNSSRPSIAAA